LKLVEKYAVPGFNRKKDSWMMAVEKSRK
jgi:hypothetical protein